MAAVEIADFETPSLRRGHALWRDTDWFTRAAAIWLIVVLVVIIAGSALPLGSPTEIGSQPRLAPPSRESPFGTDELGREMLPRVVEGMRTTLLIASVATVITIALGGLIGMMAGHTRGLFDGVTSRVSEILFAFPALLLALLIATVVGFGSPAAVLSIVLITLPLTIRVVRAATISVSERDFVLVARVQGASLGRILFVHVTPNVAGVIATQGAYVMSIGMLIESGLSFLGLGVQPPSASLGSLVRNGTQYLTIAPWLVFIPGAALASLILAVNLIGDGIRDALDPRTPRNLE